MLVQSTGWLLCACVHVCVCLSVIFGLNLKPELSRCARKCACMLERQREREVERDCVYLKSTKSGYWYCVLLSIASNRCEDGWFVIDMIFCVLCHQPDDCRHSWHRTKSPHKLRFDWELTLCVGEREKEQSENEKKINRKRQPTIRFKVICQTESRVKLLNPNIKCVCV